MILDERLQANAKRVVLEYISIVLRRACCAPPVILQNSNAALNETTLSLPRKPRKTHTTLRTQFAFRCHTCQPHPGGQFCGVLVAMWLSSVQTSWFCCAPHLYLYMTNWQCPPSAHFSLSIPDIHITSTSTSASALTYLKGNQLTGVNWTSEGPVIRSIKLEYCLFEAGA
jgi:hypothetical protein